jgi:GNAT superfamily N-acetyltransferase
MICKLPVSSFALMLNVINDAAGAYKGVIPVDMWKEPYMLAEELEKEIENGVEFYGCLECGALVAVMGIQLVGDVTLVRHAYVRMGYQRKGIGENLLNYLLSLVKTGNVLVGTWEAAYWAVRFYEKQGFRLVSNEEKNRLLRKYWNIPERQIETSVVLKRER